MNVFIFLELNFSFYYYYYYYYYYYLHCVRLIMTIVTNVFRRKDKK